MGAVFDGNIESLGGAFGFDDRVNRTVSVSTAAITEALKNVYGDQSLVAELTATTDETGVKSALTVAVAGLAMSQTFGRRTQNSAPKAPPPVPAKFFRPGASAAKADPAGAVRG